MKAITVDAYLAARRAQGQSDRDMQGLWIVVRAKGRAKPKRELFYGHILQIERWSSGGLYVIHLHHGNTDEIYPGDLVLVDTPYLYTPRRFMALGLLRKRGIRRE